MENRKIINFPVGSEQGKRHAMPDFIFARLGSKDRNDPKVNNHCPTCGYQPPTQVLQGYVRTECRCERLARFERQDQAIFEQDRAKEQAREISADTCYTWLGEDYSEYGLDENTFDVFSIKVYKTVEGKRVRVDQENERYRQYAKMRAMQFAEAPSGTFILYGPCGTGKTLLASAILNRQRALGKSGRFTTGANFFNALLAEEDAVKRQKLIVPMFSTPLLVLDDPEYAAATEFRINTYKEIFNKRSNRNLPTVITTNTMMKENAMELQHVFGTASASRLNKGLILIGLRGEDYRTLQIG